MEINLPLDKMTIEDKIVAMEQLWEDLCRSPESVSSPPWHEEVLVAREKSVREGKAKFSDFGAVKNKIRNSTK